VDAVAGRLANSNLVANDGKRTQTVQLTIDEFNLVENVFSFAIGVFGVSALFLLLQRGEVAPRYRVMVTLLSLVSAAACYNYSRMFQRWNDAFTIVNETVQNTGRLYDDTFRYADWLLAVPLLLIALVLSLDMPARQTRMRAIMLGSLAAEMIALGYPGLTSNSPEVRWVWLGIAMVPFLLILYQLLVSLSSVIANQPPGARALISGARYVVVVVWCFYPIVYVMPMLGATGAISFVSGQIIYAVGDMIAKACYGVLLYAAAARKSNSVSTAALEPTALIRPIRSQAG